MAISTGVAHNLKPHKCRHRSLEPKRVLFPMMWGMAWVLFRLGSSPCQGQSALAEARRCFQAERAPCDAACVRGWSCLVWYAGTRPGCAQPLCRSAAVVPDVLPRLRNLDLLLSCFWKGQTFYPVFGNPIVLIDNEKRFHIRWAALGHGCCLHSHRT